MPTAKTRVVWADDAELYRIAMVQLVEGPTIEVVGQAWDYDSTIRVVTELEPDVAILDIRMPPTGSDEGVRAAIELRAAGLRTGFLIVSKDLDAETAERLLRGCDRGVGYLEKDHLGQRVEDLRGVIEVVRVGGVRLDPRLVEPLMARKRASDALTKLSAAELATLALVAEGRSNIAIAEVLIVSPRTVEDHVSSIFRKLGLHAEPEVHRRVLAAVIYLRSLG